MNRREALAALVSLPATARISVAQLKPKDVIVVEVDQHLTKESMDRIRTHLVQVWPGRQVVVLGKGMTLKVVAGA